MNAGIRIQLLTLAQGERLLRFEDDASGLCMEKKVHPEKPLVAQKTSLMKIFEDALRSDAAAVQH